MFYVVKRASQWKGKDKPCDEAQEYFTICNGDLVKVWLVYIETIQQLQDFANKYSDIIFGKSDEFPGTFEILIYDDYIE